MIVECKTHAFNNGSLTGLIANTNGFFILNKLSCDIWWFHEQLSTIINFHSHQNSQICCYKTISKTLRNITRYLSKDNWTPFRKLADLLENPRLHNHFTPPIYTVRHPFYPLSTLATNHTVHLMPSKRYKEYSYISNNITFS